jgi:hypothetical protein
MTWSYERNRRKVLVFELGGHSGCGTSAPKLWYEGASQKSDACIHVEPETEEVIHCLESRKGQSVAEIADPQGFGVGGFAFFAIPL